MKAGDRTLLICETFDIGTIVTTSGGEELARRSGCFFGFTLLLQFFHIIQGDSSEDRSNCCTLFGTKKICFLAENERCPESWRLCR